MQNNIPKLGDRVRNIITGFTGIASTHASHLAGCDRLWIEPPVDANGKAGEGQWCDIDLMEVVDAGAIARVVYERRAPGGFDLPKSR